MKRQPFFLLVLFLMTFFSDFLLASNGLCQDEIETIKLSRYTAIAMAIRNNIDLRVRALDSSLAETDIQSSMSIYNPQLSVAANYAQTNVAGENYGTEDISGVLSITQKLSSGGNISATTWTGPSSAYADPLYDYTDWSSAIGLTIYQPLLKNAGKEATELDISQDKYAYAGSLESFRDEVIQTVFSVVSEYNRLYVLHQLLESREEALLSAQQLLKEIKANPKPGENLNIDIANTEYALSQRQTEYIEASRSVSSKEASLRYLIGIKQMLHILPVDPPSREEPAETEEQAIALSLEQRPDLKELHLQLESSELRERVSKRDLWPDLSLSAGGGFRGYAEDGSFGDTVSQISDGKGQYWSAGVRISFPFGNDQAESTHRRNSLRTEQLKNKITAAEWKIRDEIQEDNRSLISARLQMRETAKAKTLAEQRVAQYRKNQRLGTASIKDLLDAENDLIYARNLELSAVENFAFLVSRLWKDIGVLLERHNIRIDTSHPEELTAEDLPAIPTDDKRAAAVAKTMVFPAVAPLETSPDAAKAEKQLEKKSVEPAAKMATVIQTNATPVTKPAKALVNGLAVTETTKHVPVTSSYTLKIGEYLASEVASIKKKIVQSGLVPVVIDGFKQEREVFRLLIGEYKGYSVAQKALEDLKNVRISGFILENASNKYEVYAGSFFTRESAKTEQKRLATQGIHLSLKKVSVSLPAFLLTAGSFASREAAVEGAKKLEQQGLIVEILQS
jgi:outer membrane protein TolC/cell division protein FtsN